MRRRRRRKAIQMYTRIGFSIIAILLLMLVIKNTQARYTSSATSNVNFDLAYFVVKPQSISQDLKLEDILPSDNAYTYNFSVSNFDGTDRTQTMIDYDIEIKTTTNLPIQISVHRYGESTSVIDDEETVQDDYGTYYNVYTLEGATFCFTQNETHAYVLEVLFPEQYKLAQYEGIMEYIKITVDSRQKM